MRKSKQTCCTASPMCANIAELSTSRVPRLQALREAEELLTALRELHGTQVRDAAARTASSTCADHGPQGPSYSSFHTGLSAKTSAAQVPRAEVPDVFAMRQEYLMRKPDFRALSRLYPQLVSHVHPKTGRIDFCDWHASHTLTQVLFEDGFGVKQWRVPEGRLVPPLPNRMNYLLWMSDLLALSCTGAILI